MRARQHQEKSIGTPLLPSHLSSLTKSPPPPQIKANSHPFNTQAIYLFLPRHRNPPSSSLLPLLNPFPSAHPSNTHALPTQLIFPLHQRSRLTPLPPLKPLRSPLPLFHLRSMPRASLSPCLRFPPQPSFPLPSPPISLPYDPSTHLSASPPLSSLSSPPSSAQLCGRRTAWRSFRRFPFHRPSPQDHEASPQ